MYILAQTPIQAFWESFYEGLGRSVGDVAALIVAALGYTAIAFVLWGLPWSRIIAKAGYKGRAYWTLFLMIFVPVLIGPWIVERFGEESTLAIIISLLGALGVYLNLLYLAFARWPVYKELKQLRPKPPQPPTQRL
jgi:hypothetical protein